MVNVRESLPLTNTGELDLDAATQRLCEGHVHLQADEVRQVVALLDAELRGIAVRDLELAETVAELNMDQPSVLAAMVYRTVRRAKLPAERVIEIVGSEAAEIAHSVAAMATSSLLEMSNSPLLEKERQDQVENVKRMLASLIDDARVAVVKLAERVLALRQAKRYEPQRRIRIAQEAQGVFAPLAGRLGIWQLKWELEDLSLRYTNETAYKEIAKSLQGRRVEREAQVEQIVEHVKTLLSGQDIHAQVYGRAKHIYSIWRKMQHKNVAMDQVYDVRAVRVIVGSLAECYAALGVIHSTWQHLPAEFDDYIANPKENGYRSIHTAVTGSDGHGLEIQIRTHAMHQDAELGVCAHWSYKHDDAADANYDAKMDWLRQVMEWHEELGGTERISTLLQHRVAMPRLFVSTPKGHVLDLPAGATVLDFAYRVHTELGHACEGGLVNGQAANLSRELVTAQQVSIVRGDSTVPSRDWAERDIGYVTTDRARAKIVAFFRGLSDLEKEAEGRASLMRLCLGLGLEKPSDREIERLCSAPVDEALRALGAAETSLVEVVLRWMQDSISQVALPGIDPLPGPERAVFRVEGNNRDGLLNELTQLVTQLGLGLTSTTGRVSNDAQRAIITLEVDLEDPLLTLKFVSYLQHIRDVDSVVKLPAA